MTISSWIWSAISQVRGHHCHARTSRASGLDLYYLLARNCNPGSECGSNTIRFPSLSAISKEILACGAMDVQHCRHEFCQLRAAWSTVCAKKGIDMTNESMTRRDFGKALGAAATCMALPTILPRQARAADTVRQGLQIGAMGALRTTLPAASNPYDLTFDVKDFPDSTSVLLAIEQGELEIGNTTTQHLTRAISGRDSRGDAGRRSRRRRNRFVDQCGWRWRWWWREQRWRRRWCLCGELHRRAAGGGRWWWWRGRRRERWSCGHPGQ